MYSQQEASLLRQEFWTSLGLYLNLHKSADGEKVNWLNYKTGVKSIAFKMIADRNAATIFIEISHPDLLTQEIYYSKFLELQNQFVAITGEPWKWNLHKAGDHGKVTSTIGISLEKVSIFNKADWPAMISFFKPRIIAIDAFWCTFKYGFEDI